MSNRFRPAHRALSQAEADAMSILKDRAEELARLFDDIGGREGAIANTHLETAIMFAVKGLTR
jgi:hypothetical protein